MKLNFDASFKAMTLVSIAALFTFTAAAQTAKREAQVLGLAGDVRHSSGGGSFAPLSIGTKLHEGDVIKTGRGSHADIDLGDNVGLVQVAPHSTFAVRTLTTTRTDADTVTETDLDLKEGAVFFKVNKLAKASRFEITTPKGIAGIRGTSGSMTADGQLTVGDGMAGAAFPGAGGVETFIVNAGETVGPTDKPPHAAPEQWLRDIVDALSDAATHGIGRDTRPFVPPIEPFISTVLPGR
jgi:hypothetical protein